MKTEDKPNRKETLDINDNEENIDENKNKDEKRNMTPENTNTGQKSLKKQETKKKNKIRSKPNEKLKIETNSTIKKLAEADKPAQGIKIVCSKEQYKEFKEALIRYHCARIGEVDCLSDAPRKSNLYNS